MTTGGPVKIIDKRFTIFCGGRGSGELANQLLDLGADVTCCVNAYDDGLSTGRLREIFGELGPSDIRKNLLSLMDIDAPGYWSRHEAFSFRYPADEARADSFRQEITAIADSVGSTADSRSGSEFQRILSRTTDDFRESLVGLLKVFLTELETAENVLGRTFSFSDAAIGNFVLMGAFYQYGRVWGNAIRELQKLLVTRGRIEMVSEENRHLFAICADGRILTSEESIITDSDGDILELFLSEKPVDRSAVTSIIESSGIGDALDEIRQTIHSPVSATPTAVDAIIDSDVLIYGSGTFHSSILPTLQIEDVKNAIKKCSGEKLMILNIVAEADTRGLKGVDLVGKIVECLGNDSIDRIAINSPDGEKGEEYFTLDEADLKQIGVNAALVRGDYESRVRPGRHEAGLFVQALRFLRPASANTADDGDKLPLVSILMLAWNRKDEVEIGLKELRKVIYPNLEIVLVDNGSIDGTAAMVYDQFPEVRVVQLHTNTGMTGYNVGLATARGKYIIMLDDDSHLASDSVSKMVNVWESPENADVGAMAFRVINPINGHLVTHLWEERIAKVEPGREREITSFAACGAAVKNDVLDEVGYFDDDFFLYATEDDLAIRMWAAGHRVVYEPRCVSYHRESRIMRNWKRYGSGFRNATWFNIKHLPLYLLPLASVRNFYWLLTRSIRFRSFQYFFYGLTGLVKGYFQFLTPIRKRKVVDSRTARFCMNDNWITRPIFSTSWRVYKEKRYILDKRGVSP